MQAKLTGPAFVTLMVTLDRAVRHQKAKALKDEFLVDSLLELRRRCQLLSQTFPHGSFEIILSEEEVSLLYLALKDY